MTSETMPRIHLTSDHPLHVLSTCKRAALRADWSLRRWVEFSESVRACFTPEALPEEAEQMLAVVRSHFAVTISQPEQEQTT